MATRSGDRWNQWTESVSRGGPVIVAGVGSGLTAKGAAKGGADVLAVYNTAIYRIIGVPTALAFLPYDDANALTFQVAPQVVAQAGDIPVILGLGVHDPRRTISELLDRIEALGGAGVTNEPFIGMYSRDLQAQLEAAGLGFSREADLIAEAVNRDMLALGWAFTPEEASRMAEAGAQLIGAMVGVTAGGPAGGASVTSMDRTVQTVADMVQAAKRVSPRALVLAHGGPLNDVSSVALVLKATGADGYVTGSTGERIPVERGVADTIRSFKTCTEESDE